MNQKIIGSIGFVVLVISCLLALGSSIAILYLHVNTLASLQEQFKTVLDIQEQVNLTSRTVSDLQEQVNLTSRTVSDLQEQQIKGVEKFAEKFGNVFKQCFIFSV